MVRATIPTRVGIHTHNDADLAVANALAAVEAGCTQVQGTMNGWGERCGNANLISIIPALQLKMDRRCVPEESLARLTELSRTVSEIANIRPRAHAPYVGASAFAHKGGAHVAAVEKLTATYEHIPPERVGNQRKVVVSELSGRGNVRMRAVELGADVRGHGEGGPGPGQGAGERGLPVRGGRGLVRAAGPPHAQPDYRPPFEMLDVVVISERRRGSEMFVEATVKLKVGDEQVHTVAEGSGPVHALDQAFHKALDPHYPLLREVQLCDYKVRILDPEAATGAKTRVLIESCQGRASAGAPSASPRTSSRPAAGPWPTRWSCRWCEPRPPSPNGSRRPSRPEAIARWDDARECPCGRPRASTVACVQEHGRQRSRRL